MTRPVHPLGPRLHALGAPAIRGRRRRQGPPVLRGDQTAMPAGLRRVIVSGRPVSPDAAALAVAAIAETGGSVDRVRALFGDPETGFELTVSGMTTGLDVRLAAVAGATGADITVEEVTDVVTDGRPQWQ